MQSVFLLDPFIAASETHLDESDQSPHYPYPCHCSSDIFPYLLHLDGTSQFRFSGVDTHCLEVNALNVLNVLLASIKVPGQSFKDNAEYKMKNSIS